MTEAVAAFGAAETAAYVAVGDAQRSALGLWAEAGTTSPGSRERWTAVQSRLHAMREAREARDAAIDVAMARLAEAAAGDPLTEWICRPDGPLWEYSNEALEVLAMLPATTRQLDDLADDLGWCDYWDGYRDAAEEAGVLTAAPAGPGAS